MSKIVICLVVILSYSCARVKRLERSEVKYSSSLYYSKVKVSVKSNLYKSVTLRGYISVIIDTSLCFKFYGPLSYEVLSGFFQRNQFKIYDNYNKRLINSSDSSLIGLVKYRLDESILESLLSGRKEDFVRSFKLLNNLIVLDTTRFLKNELSIIDNDKVCKLQWILKSGKVRSIVLNFNSDNLFYIRIDLLAVSDERRNCKFRY